MNFIPNTPKQSKKVPYFDDISSEGGWQGHATEKGLERLKTEIRTAIERLEGTVVEFVRGEFEIDGVTREGFQILYFIKKADGGMVRGRIDIAALPAKSDYRIRASMERRKDQSLRMALYMLKMALDGTWFLQQLSPGYAALMPWMLTDNNKTVSQMWAESSVMNNLLPPGDAEFVEADVVEEN